MTISNHHFKFIRMAKKPKPPFFSLEHTGVDVDHSSVLPRPSSPAVPQDGGLLWAASTYTFLSASVDWLEL